MIDFNDEIYNTEGIKGILKQLTKHLLFMVIGVVLLALPCYFVALIIFSWDTEIKPEIFREDWINGWQVPMALTFSGMIMWR